MRDCTLCFVTARDRVLLGRKKRGFGADRWIGFGGKVEPTESVEQAASRELHEECGLRARTLEAAGVLHFTFTARPDWDQRVHLFRVPHFEGEPSESEEMEPRWVQADALPYEAMWPDDRYWLPLVLAGQTVEGHFTFDEDNETILSYQLDTC